MPKFDVMKDEIWLGVHPRVPSLHSEAIPVLAGSFPETLVIVYLGAVNKEVTLTP
jgi:hypothetical protein